MCKRILYAVFAFSLLLGCSARTAESHWTESAASDGIPSAGPEVEIESGPAEPFQNEEPCRAQTLLESMTLEEKAGQMFLAHYTGENAAAGQAGYQFGGYILFAGDFNAVPKTDMLKNIKAAQDASKIKMLIGVDEEGGGINRVSSNPEYRAEPFKSPRQLYASGGFDAVAADVREKSALLKSIGVNFNLAPVCDVSTNPADYIYYRTLGQDASLTSIYAAGVVTAMNSEKIAGALKHFPGYGSNRDTHTGIARDNRSLESIRENDLKPFIAGINAGAGCILVSHNIVSSIDEENPASLSPAMHELLRDELNFDGVIMTDDLTMGAISEFTKGTGSAVAAILAGNDLLCCGDAGRELDSVLDAVRRGEISEERIDESVLRILEWKLEMEIIS